MCGGFVRSVRVSALPGVTLPNFRILAYPTIIEFLVVHRLVLVSIFVLVLLFLTVRVTLTGPFLVVLTPWSGLGVPFRLLGLHWLLLVPEGGP